MKEQMILDAELWRKACAITNLEALRAGRIDAAKAVTMARTELNQNSDQSSVQRMKTRYTRWEPGEGGIGTPLMLMSSASAMPTAMLRTAPTKPMITPSSKKRRDTSRSVSPMARSVLISRVRSRTFIIIVLLIMKTTIVLTMVLMKKKIPLNRLTTWSYKTPTELHTLLPT